MAINSTPDRAVEVGVRPSTYAKAGVFLFLALSDVVTSIDRVSTPENTTPFLRDRLPEPLDFGSHAGSFVYSMMAANAAVFATARIASRHNHNPSKIRKLALGAGVLAAAGVNAFVESKLGTGILGLEPGSIDPIDVAYGTAAGAFSATLVSSTIEK